MSVKTPAFDPSDPVQAQKRAAARKRLDAIDPAMQPGGAEADPYRRAWFEAVYALAEHDPANVPWGFWPRIRCWSTGWRIIPGWTG